MNIAALLLLSFQPALAEPVCERVDVIEVNHYFDEAGRLVFDQAIFYDWSADHGRHMVRAWRLVKHKDQLPRRDWQQGGYVANWQDGETWREVRAPIYRESHTQYDPELEEREILPACERRELRKP